MSSQVLVRDHVGSPCLSVPLEPVLVFLQRRLLSDPRLPPADPKRSIPLLALSPDINFFLLFISCLSA